jgi:hypothetical protein
VNEAYFDLAKDRVTLGRFTVGMNEDIASGANGATVDFDNTPLGA